MAGISILKLFGKNGIINNAVKAHNEVRKSNAKELIVSEVIKSKKTSEEYNSEIIKNNILTNVKNSEVFGVTFPIITNVDGYMFKIDDKGDILDVDFDYLVEFDGNGATGNMDAQGFLHNESKNLFSNQYIKEGYVFKNWNTKLDGSGQSFTDSENVCDLASKGNNFLVLYAQWEQCPAKINGVYYDTVQNAITKVPTDGTETTIQINRDTTENITIKSGQNIVFDLGNKTLDAEVNNAVITNNGTLRITNGNVESTVATGTINNNKDGKLIVDGVTIKGKQRSAIYNDKGTVEILGDSYLSSTATGCPSGQTLERGAIHNLAGGTVTIKSGTIVGIKQQALTNMGTMIIGTEGNIDATSPVIIGKTYGIKNSGILKIYDGIIKGIDDIIWGEITSQEPNTRWVDSTEVIDKKTYKVRYLEIVE